MSLHYLVKREMLITHVLPFSCYRKKLPNLSYLNCDLRFRQILIELLQCVGTIARVSVTKRTETSTENGVGQAGSRRHCDSHSSVASLIAPDHCCVFCTIFLQYFSHEVVKWIQFWRIWWPQSRWDQFWSFFSNNSMLVCVQWAFRVPQGSIETLFRWIEKCLIILQQFFSGNFVLNIISIARVL